MKLATLTPENWMLVKNKNEDHIVSLFFICFRAHPWQGAKPLVNFQILPSRRFFMVFFALLTSGWSTHRHGLQQQLDRSRPNDLGRLGPWFSLQGEKIESSAGHVGPNPFPQPPWEVVLHESLRQQVHTTIGSMYGLIFIYLFTFSWIFAAKRRYYQIDIMPVPLTLWDRWPGTSQFLFSSTWPHHNWGKKADARKEWISGCSGEEFVDHSQPTLSLDESCQPPWHDMTGMEKNPKRYRTTKGNPAPKNGLLLGNWEVCETFI